MSIPMLRQIVISNLLIIVVFMAGCSRVVSTPNTYTLVSDRSIGELQSGGYVHLVDSGNDKVSVRLRESFEQAWQSTSSAVELVGFEISEANAQRGFYILKQKPKEKKDKSFVIRTSGVLKHLESLESFGKDGSEGVKSVRIRLISLEDNSTKIVPVDGAGNWDTRDVAVDTIKQLHKAFSENNNSIQKTEELNNTQRLDTVVTATSSQISADLSGPVSSVSDSATTRVKLIDTGNGKVSIHLLEGFEQAWFSTARALKQIGLNISEADSLRGLYTLGTQKEKDEGLKIRLSGVFKHLESPDSDDDKSVRLSLTDLGDSSTKIVPVDGDGEWDTSDKAIATVNQLYRSFNQL